MRTRKVFVSGLFDIEHRTEGWFFTQLQSKEGWSGPYRNVAEVVNALATELEEQLRLFYQLRYKEAPR